MFADLSAVVRIKLATLKLVIAKPVMMALLPAITVAAQKPSTAITELAPVAVEPLRVVAPSVALPMNSVRTLFVAKNNIPDAALINVALLMNIVTMVFVKSVHQGSVAELFVVLRGKNASMVNAKQ